MLDGQRLGVAQARLLLRVDEVAQMIGVSKATAYDLISRKEIPSIRLAGRGGRGLLRVPADALQRLIADRTAEARRDER
jgi:excisionase family DNA binding protein